VLRIIVYSEPMKSILYLRKIRVISHILYPERRILMYRNEFYFYLCEKYKYFNVFSFRFAHTEQLCLSSVHKGLTYRR